MPPTRFTPSLIKNKIKRQEIASKNKKAKTQDKLKRRLENAKQEANDPLAQKKRIAENVPRTLDNQREFDPSILTTDPNQPGASGSNPDFESLQQEREADLATDPFASYFNSDEDPSLPPKVLVTTSPKASKATYEFCDEVVGVFPGAEFIRRKKGKGFEMGRIAGWCADRGYKHLIVVNEDMKKPNAITFIHLPNGPTAYFKLTSIELTKQIYGHARATPHHPELNLNGFVTRLGHAVGRMFQTAFPPLPEFQGRQIVTLHNQRDFIFFRRHRYAFRSPEKVQLQEIGPRFTLKLRSLKKGIPAVYNLGEAPAPLTMEKLDDEESEQKDNDIFENPPEKSEELNKTVPPKQNEVLWQWKPELETSRRTFFL
ncbi:Brix-domain-containing protein [Coprinopsis marcescibilis]|uniref:Brix-domain-containing protein n=1 Tax=Coprinopsis marcescibilis TaxID=230819 RepID=A0A5C3KZV6_COPMA|nr:Brix-domain-containing protein [Coprinopsis marcescibilis]